jgi:hypothetical protein
MLRTQSSVLFGDVLGYLKLTRVCIAEAVTYIHPPSTLTTCFKKEISC